VLFVILIHTGSANSADAGKSRRGFIGNPFDGHTTEPLPDQMEDSKIALPKELAYGRGSKGKPEIFSTEKERYGLSETEKTQTNYDWHEKESIIIGCGFCDAVPRHSILRTNVR
jgi:hypothetical protein